MYFSIYIWFKMLPSSNCNHEQILSFSISNQFIENTWRNKKDAINSYQKGICWNMNPGDFLWSKEMVHKRVYSFVKKILTISHKI